MCVEWSPSVSAAQSMVGSHPISPILTLTAASDAVRHLNPGPDAAPNPPLTLNSDMPLTHRKRPCHDNGDILCSSCTMCGGSTRRCGLTCSRRCTHAWADPVMGPRPICLTAYWWVGRATATCCAHAAYHTMLMCSVLPRSA